MSSLSPDLYSLIQMVTMVLSMILGCVVLAGVLLLFVADRRSYTLCMVIGVTVNLLLQFYGLLAWFPNLGFMVNGDAGPEEFQKYFAYFSVVDLIGRIFFGYGILMMGIAHLKLSRNPDFRRE